MTERMCSEDSKVFIALEMFRFNLNLIHALNLTNLQCNLIKISSKHIGHDAGSVCSWPLLVNLLVLDYLLC